MGRPNFKGIDFQETSIPIMKGIHNSLHHMIRSGNHASHGHEIMCLNGELNKKVHILQTGRIPSERKTQGTF